MVWSSVDGQVKRAGPGAGPGDDGPGGGGPGGEGLGGDGSGRDEDDVVGVEDRELCNEL